MPQATRLVEVYVADINDSVPLGSRLLYSSPRQMTDLDDQELFFEIDIKTILAKHNEFRVTYTDKAAKDKDTKLEPARVRDLRMTVVTVAPF